MPFSTDIADDIEAKALTYAIDIVDIYSNSWGPPENNQLLGAAGPLVQRAIEIGIHKVKI